jgi:hypothetical protein
MGGVSGGRFVNIPFPSAKHQAAARIGKKISSIHPFVLLQVHPSPDANKTRQRAVSNDLMTSHVQRTTVRQAVSRCEQSGILSSRFTS